FTEDIEPLVIENYVSGGQVRYVFRHFPFLDDQAAGSESDQPASASMCAAEQGRFWDYHDMLFANWNGENQGAFIDKRLVAFAEALNLDMDEFNACFEQNEYQDVIAEDLAAGRQAGVTGTPSVLVNGSMISPGFVPSFQDIEAAVRAELDQTTQ
ncbi:MAG TPA: thioredoxin domain-containing protein, partial [Anaerolineales bacterium]